MSDAGFAAPHLVEIAAWFAPAEHAGGILAAVSGGPDSMALMWLLSRWAAQPNRPRIEVATVDHGLRPQAAAEAALVAAAAGRLGLRHHTLCWEGDKPATRLQECARDARYALLDACARRISADVLMTAHHADDQAETILFRLQRGSGLSGLAGMAKARQHGDLRLLRPLLGVPKARLSAICAAAQLPVVDDPSNADTRYARARLRRLAPLLEAEGLDRDAWLRLGARVARAEQALGAMLETALVAGDAEFTQGAFSADLSRLVDPPDEILLRILLRGVAHVVAHVAAQARPQARASPRPPRLNRAEALCARLVAALRTGNTFSSTLHGAHVRLSAGGVLSMRAEAPRRKNASHSH